MSSSISRSASACASGAAMASAPYQQCQPQEGDRRVGPDRERFVQRLGLAVVDQDEHLVLLERLHGSLVLRLPVDRPGFPCAGTRAVQLELVPFRFHESAIRPALMLLEVIVLHLLI